MCFIRLDYNMNVRKFIKLYLPLLELFTVNRTYLNLIELFRLITILTINGIIIYR